MQEPLASLPIQPSLVADTQALAKELDMPWSRLITLALNDFVRRNRKRQQFIDKINEAYADAPDEQEKRIQEGMRKTQRRLLEGEW